MKSPLFFAASIAALCGPSIFYAADKGGAEGGGTSVADLLAKITGLETDKKTLTTQLADETKKVTALEMEKGTLTTQLADETKKVTAFEGEKTVLKAEVITLKDEVKNLEAADQTAAQRQQEIAAKNGVGAVNRDQTQVNANAAGDCALWEQYVKADSTKQAAMRAEHGDKLDKAAAAYDARVAAKS